MIRRSIAFALAFAAFLGAARAEAAVGSERKPHESYAQCKQRISSVPPCNKWTRECAQRCGFMY